MKLPRLQKSYVRSYQGGPLHGRTERAPLRFRQALPVIINKSQWERVKPWRPGVQTTTGLESFRKIDNLYVSLEKTRRPRDGEEYRYIHITKAAELMDGLPAAIDAMKELNAAI